MDNLDEVNKRGAKLHNELINGDPLAPSRIAELFLPSLAEVLHRKFHNIADPHLVEIAIADALLEYFTNPNKFNPARGKLFTYLCISSQGDLLNHLHRERNYASRKSNEEVVELQPSETVKNIEADPEASLLHSEEARCIQEAVNAILTEDQDRAVVALMLDGVRETIAYADVLGLTDRPLEEQVLLVKRTKDRIKVALRRGLEGKTAKP